VRTFKCSHRSENPSPGFCSGSIFQAAEPSLSATLHFSRVASATLNYFSAELQKVFLFFRIESDFFFPLWWHDTGTGLSGYSRLSWRRAAPGGACRRGFKCREWRTNSAMRGGQLSHKKKEKRAPNGSKRRTVGRPADRRGHSWIDASLNRIRCGGWPYSITLELAVY